MYWLNYNDLFYLQFDNSTENNVTRFEYVIKTFS